jgi:hypothetical protein
VEQFGTIRNTQEHLEQEFQILLQTGSELRLEFQTVAPTVAPGAVAPTVAPGTVSWSSMQTLAFQHELQGEVEYQLTKDHLSG